MRVLGIDPGTANLGWAVVDGERVVAGGRMGTAPGDLDGRILGLVGSVSALAVTWRVVRVAIEEFQHGDRERVRHSSKAMNRLIGALVVTFRLANMPVAVYPARLWQRGIMGPCPSGRRRTKREVMGALKLRGTAGLGKLKNQHAVDAAGIALWDGCCARLAHFGLDFELKMAARKRQGG